VKERIQAEIRSASRRRLAAIVTLSVLGNVACVVTPDNHNGVPSSSASVTFTGYVPNALPPTVTLQQRRHADLRWVNVRTATPTRGSFFRELAPGWLEWTATMFLSNGSNYWKKHPSFGGLSRTVVRIAEMPRIIQDLPLATNCASQFPLAGGGYDGTAIANACGVEASMVLNTCRIGGVLSCGVGDYPTTQQRSELAALTGYTALPSGTTFVKLTGRSTSAQREATRNLIVGSLGAAGAATQIHAFSGGNNVIGILAPNGGPQLAPIVVGAHYDTSSEFNAGATDNGTGVVVMLDAARYLARVPNRRRPVWFVAFDREENNLGGSAAFVRDFRSRNFHSAHMADQIGGNGVKVNIEAPSDAASLTDCMWNTYNAANQAGALEIVLERITQSTQTDMKSFLDAGIRAANVSTSTQDAGSPDCIQNRSCASACLGDCAAGVFCPENICRDNPSLAHVCEDCDSYDKIDFEKIASVSMLFRLALERVVTRTDTSCP
jgi:Peptidase family M28